MIRRALEWVGGSVLVYVLVAACAGAGGPGSKDDEDPSGGDGDSLSGDGDHVSGDGGQIAGDGDSTPGDGDAPGDGDLMGDGDLLDPVPDADAAEDGQRIVNIYRTTNGGLETHEGYWDTQLSVKCSFQKQADGKSYCMPALEGYSIYTFSDAECTQPVVGVACGSAVPTSVVGVYTFSTTCGSGGYYHPYEIGSKVTLTSYYVKTTEGGACTEQVAVEGTEYYSVGAKIPLTDLVEGFSSHGS